MNSSVTPIILLLFYSVLSIVKINENEIRQKKKMETKQTKRSGKGSKQRPKDQCTKNQCILLCSKFIWMK